jgi:outer membrane immunogenic protein
MNRLLLIASILALGSAGASAADLAPRTYTKAPVVEAAYNWSGWYAGANAGYSWSDSTGSLNAFTPDLAVPVAGGGTPAFLNTKHEGGFGGGQVGYNWQVGRWLVGLEADVDGADIGRTSLVSFPGSVALDPTNSTGRDHIDWFGTFRGRVGVTANNVLFYGTGGLAFGGTHSTATNVDALILRNGNFTGSTSDTRLGWAAGAGIEWGLARNWTLKAEYLHVDLGSTNVTLTDPNFPGIASVYRFNHQFDTVRLGVNYLFGGPLVAKY